MRFASYRGGAERKFWAREKTFGEPNLNLSSKGLTTKNVWAREEISSFQKALGLELTHFKSLDKSPTEPNPHHGSAL